MELKLKALTADPRFGIRVRLLHFCGYIRKPSHPAQRANIRCNPRRVELLAGMNRKPGLCRFRCDAMKSDELDFANDGMGQEAIQYAGGSIRIAGIPCLGTCENWRHNEQRKKRHGYGSTTAHVSQHLEKD